MNIEEYVKYDAMGLAELEEKGEVTGKELASLAQEAAEKVNNKLNAIVSIFDEPYKDDAIEGAKFKGCLLYTSPSPRDLSTSRMPSSA